MSGISGISAYGRIYAPSPVAQIYAGKRAQPETPVTPVEPVEAVEPRSTPLVTYAPRTLPNAQGWTDPNGNIARVFDPGYADRELLPGGASALEYRPLLPGQGSEENAPPNLPGGEQGIQEAKSPAEVVEETQCQTCKRRKYQDGSDDPGVSFKSPTNLTPDQAATAVRGHEQEHVVRERAEAAREGRHVVSQSVTIHTDICPECGRVYVSGGLTETVTAKNPEPKTPKVQAPDFGSDIEA